MTPRTALSPLAPLALAVLGAAAPAAQQDLQVARHDLGALVPGFDEWDAVESLYFRSGGTEHELHRVDAEGLRGDPDPGEVVDLVARVLGQELELEGRRLDLQEDGTLVVVAPPAVQARVRAVLDALEEAFARHVELTVDVVDLPADAPPLQGGLLPAERAAELVSAAAGREGGERHVVRARPGRATLVERVRRIPHVAGWDVEIAQGAVVHDPIVALAEEGMRMLVRASAAEGGVALSLVFGLGEAEGPTRRELAMGSFVGTEAGVEPLPGPRVAEVVDVRFRAAALDAFVPAGQALVVVSDLDVAGAASRRAIVVRPTGGGGPAVVRRSFEGTRRELVLVDVEALHPPGLRVHGRLLSEEEVILAPTLAAGVRTREAVALWDWVDARFTTWRAIGPWLAIVYDPSWDGGAADELERVVQGWVETPSTATVQVAVRAEGGATPVAWSLPVRTGGRFAAVAGLSTVAQRDYDVEVAQFAGTVDPVTMALFSGLALRGGVAAGASGPTVELRALAQLRREDGRTVEVEGPLVGAMDLAALDRVWVDEVVRAGDGAARTVGRVGGTAGPGFAIDVAVR